MILIPHLLASIVAEGMSTCRCAQALAYIEGRAAVRPSDIQRLAVPVLAHRLIVDLKARHGGLTGESVVTEALQQEPVPA